MARRRLLQMRAMGKPWEAAVHQGPQQVQAIQIVRPRTSTAWIDHTQTTSTPTRGSVQAGACSGALALIDPHGECVDRIVRRQVVEEGLALRAQPDQGPIVAVVRNRHVDELRAGDAARPEERDVDLDVPAAARTPRHTPHTE